MNVTIFGSGYVGLVTGACLADVGHNVLCMDVDQSKLDKIKLGMLPIFEPGLEGIVMQNMQHGTLKFTSNVEEAVAHGEILFIAVGTPPDEDGSADLKYVKEVARNIATHMQDYKLVVTKSTVPVGTS